MPGSGTNEKALQGPLEEEGKAHIIIKGNKVGKRGNKVPKHCSQENREVPETPGHNWSWRLAQPHQAQGIGYVWVCCQIPSLISIRSTTARPGFFPLLKVRFPDLYLFPHLFRIGWWFLPSRVVMIINTFKCLNGVLLRKVLC